MYPWYCRSDEKRPKFIFIHFGCLVINNLKYDTDKMELISDECEYWYKGELLGTPMRYRGRDVRLWRSSKGNWLLTYKSDYTTYGKALCEKEVENILIQYDLEMYEQIFGEVEEA